MHVEIRNYKSSQDYPKLLNVIQSEGEEWASYSQGSSKSKYENALSNSITYVAVVDGNIGGYSRSINDSGLYIWIIDLLVHPKYRGHSIGKKLMECLKTEYSNLDILVMSDVDEYYKKLGYSNEGTIFKIH